MKLVSCHAKTHHGPFLSLNEDNYCFDFDNNLFMVLDAFGGSGVGDEGLKFTEETIRKFYGRIVDDPEATQPFFYSPQYTLEANALINALLYTHKLLLKKNHDKPLDERVGLSGIFLVKDESYINIINIGTTRSYLLRDHKLQLLLSDHSLNSFRQKDTVNIPHFALGLVDDLNYGIKSFHVEENDQVLLMSDGVYDFVSEQDMKEILENELASSQKIENLFQLADNKGNIDNQTFLILEF